jgi:hypothetical protein
MIGGVGGVTIGGITIGVMTIGVVTMGVMTIGVVTTGGVTTGDAPVLTVTVAGPLVVKPSVTLYVKLAGPLKPSANAK